MYIIGHLAYFFLFKKYIIVKYFSTSSSRLTEAIARVQMEAYLSFDI